MNSQVTANVPGRGLCRISITGGRIAEIVRLEAERADELSCSPGFVDMQINGFAGIDFSAPELTVDGAASVAEKLWASGVTSFCPTLVTSPLELLERSFRVLEETRRRWPDFAASVPCYHLEGPYLSPGGAHGAHDPSLMRRPDWDEFSRLQSAAGGRIGILTLAPELSGAQELIRRASESGVLVSIGHTDAAPEDIHAAARAGARMSTHLGNGSPEFMHRHHAPMWAQLSNDNLHAGMICDGFHLPSELVQVITRVKGPDRCVLVTDAIHVAGLEPGDYHLGTTPIRLLPTGQVVTRGAASSMAGSTVKMSQAIERYQALGNVPLAAALQAATENPAALLGRTDEVCGRLEVGAVANLAIWHSTDGGMDVDAVYLRGSRK